MNHEQYKKALHVLGLDENAKIKLGTCLQEDGIRYWEFRWWPYVSTGSGFDYSQRVTIRPIGDKWRVEWRYHQTIGASTRPSFIEAYMLGDIICKKRRKEHNDAWVFHNKAAEEAHKRMLKEVQDHREMQSKEEKKSILISVVAIITWLAILVAAIIFMVCRI